MTLEQVKQWLQDEINDYSYDIHVGRMECAESLLKQIEESEHE